MKRLTIDGHDFSDAMKGCSRVISETNPTHEWSFAIEVRQGTACDAYLFDHVGETVALEIRDQRGKAYRGNAMVVEYEPIGSGVARLDANGPLSVLAE